MGTPQKGKLKACPRNSKIGWDYKGLSHIKARIPPLQGLLVWGGGVLGRSILQDIGITRVGRG
jgi:hypothetical protein